MTTRKNSNINIINKIYPELTLKIMGFKKYQADLGDAPLMVPEAKVIAKLLLDRIEKQEFIEKIQDENILQYPNTVRARRHGFIIRSRLKTAGEELWELAKAST